MKNQTPFEAWYGHKPSLNFLKIFGCLCFTHIPQMKHDKLVKRASSGIFIGYSNVTKAYKVFQTQTRKIVINRDVHFVEDEEWNWDEARKTNQASNDLKLNFPLLYTVERKSGDWQNEMVDDIPIRGTRLLSEVYQKCNIAVCEPVGFEEAKLD